MLNNLTQQHEYPGKLFVVEGIDGSGKTTQLALLAKWLIAEGHRVFVTGEAVRPGPYGLRPDRMLSALLADIGELTPQAGHEVLIIRPPGLPLPTPEPALGDSPDGEPAPSPSPSPTPPTRAPYPGEVQGSEIIHVKLREVRSGLVASVSRCPR